MLIGLTYSYALVETSTFNDAVASNRCILCISGSFLFIESVVLMLRTCIIWCGFWRTKAIKMVDKMVKLSTRRLSLRRSSSRCIQNDFHQDDFNCINCEWQQFWYVSKLMIGPGGSWLFDLILHHLSRWVNLLDSTAIRERNFERTKNQIYSTIKGNVVMF